MSGGPDLAHRTARTRLRPWLGSVPGPATGPATAAAGGVEIGLTWYGGADIDPARPGSEPVVQALCGLMHLHGQEAGRPRRLGLEAASAAAGVLAGQGVLAAHVGRARGIPVDAVETSVLRAGALLAGQYTAEATSPDPWGPSVKGDGGPPPFRSADGPLFEIETFDPARWLAFWRGLGVDPAVLGRAWTAFQHRYLKGHCLLPAALHTAAAGTPWPRIVAAAQEHGLSLSALRGYRDVLAEPGWSPGQPRLTPLPAPCGGRQAAAPQSAAAGRTGDLPLAGIRVVEATSRVQGPLAGQLLTMLGADVTWVEPPQGDASGMGSLYHRGKRRTGLDLSRPAGRDALRELIAEADVFLHNWRPGKAAEWGFAAGELARTNPRLVFGEASGWGPHLDRREVIGTEFMVQAYAGVSEGNTPRHERPATTRVLLCDMFGALVACEGVLAGLYRRELSGHGWTAESSLLTGAMALQSHVVLGRATGDEPGRSDGRPVWGAIDEPVATADGYLMVSADDDPAHQALCEALEVPLGRRGERDDQLAPRLREAPAAQWEKLLTEAGVPAAAVCRDLSDPPRDPRLAPLFEPFAGGGQAPVAPWLFH